MNYLQKNFPNYDCNKKGTVYKKGEIITPFKSNKYLQVCLYDKHNKRKVCGVHTVIAMKYLDYYDGCVVHHKDGNQQNNNLDNLEINSRAKHASLHSKNNPNLKLYRKGVVPWNKGMKMSEEFCKHCSESAKKRGFNGNQYVKK